MRLILRRLRGAIGNAFVWGTLWFLAGIISIVGFGLLQTSRAASWELWGTWEVWRAIFRFATPVAAIGAVTGGAFSAYIAANFRNSRLHELSPGRFALGGGLVTTLLSLLFMCALSLRSGWGLPLLGDVLPVLGVSVVVGSVTGFASLKLAKRELPPGRSPVQLKPRGGALLPEG